MSLAAQQTKPPPGFPALSLYARGGIFFQGHPGAGAAPGGRGALWRPAGASVARKRFNGRRVLWPTA